MPPGALHALRAIAPAAARRAGVRRLSLGYRPKRAAAAPAAAPDDGSGTGFCGIPELRRPEGFEVLAKRSSSKIESLIDKLERMEPSVEVIRAMDEISDSLCSVVDAAELCRNVHNAEFVEAAHGAYAHLSNYMQKLNTHVPLYDALRRVQDSARVVATLSEEQARVLALLLHDFERSGIHLGPEGHERFVRLQDEIMQLGTLFSQNASSSPALIAVSPASKLSALPEAVLRHAASAAAAAARRPGPPSVRDVVHIPTDAVTLGAVLKWVRDPDVRRRAYVEGYSSAGANLGVLERLMRARHELARLLGFPSYAHMAVSDKLAGSPEALEAFLRGIAAEIGPKADEELRLLEGAKLEMEGSGRVHAWDRPFYQGLVKAERCALDGRALAAYFPLDGVLRGLSLISSRLFGVSLLEEPAARGEAWDPTVRKLVAQDEAGRPIGTMYLDLYPRRGKYDHSAHFTVRCGRLLPSGEYQRPVIALVMNFPQPAPDRPSLLSHGEVEVLFHEFGHAMHTMLSRTEFQHVSGTRCASDFVETPSHLMEYFCWDERALGAFARHHRTGEAIPRALVAKLRESKSMFSAMETQSQVFQSVLDLRYFGEEAGAASPPDTTATLRDLQNALTNVPHVEGTAWQTKFGHLVSYGASYYSYVFAKVFGADIWHTVFAADPLSREAGERYRREILAPGGSREPRGMLRALLGRDPSTRPFLAECGVPGGGAGPSL
eukprot:tig00001302_g8095.t1